MAEPETLLSYDDVLALEQPEPDFRIRYGDDPLQFGELRLPEGRPPFPVAVVVHGGCWRSHYDITHIRNLADALRHAGMATWALEYRRVGNPGGGFPGTFLDVAAGLDHVKNIATEHGLDVHRVIALGHSAGGHLALWLAGRVKLGRASKLRGGEPLRLQGVLALAAVDDLRGAVAGKVCGDMAAQLLGGTPDDVPERYDAASPLELLPFGIPLAVVHGERDALVPASFARHFAAAAESFGDQVTLTLVEDAGHFELIVPGSSAWPAVLDASRALLGP